MCVIKKGMALLEYILSLLDTAHDYINICLVDSQGKSLLDKKKDNNPSEQLKGTTQGNKLRE